MMPFSKLLVIETEEVDSYLRVPHKLGREMNTIFQDFKKSFDKETIDKLKNNVFKEDKLPFFPSSKLSRRG